MKFFEMLIHNIDIANEPCDGECSYGCAMINNKEQCYCPSGREIILPGGTQCAGIKKQL